MSKKKRELQYMSTLYMGIYPGHVLFTCGYKINEILDDLKERGFTEWHDGIAENNLKDDQWYALKRVVENNKHKPVTLYYIIIPSFDRTDYDYCKLAHEVLHICQFHLPDILDRNREWESEAYLHTHLMQQCLEVLSTKTSKK
jgi:hypothetical protein